MADRGLLNDRADRPVASWRKVILVVMAVLLPLALWDKRGAIIGLIALVVYGGVFLAAAFDQRRTMMGPNHAVALHAALTVLLTFLALAYVTDLSLGVCGAIGVAAAVVFVPVARWRRGGQAHA